MSTEGIRVEVVAEPTEEAQVTAATAPLLRQPLVLRDFPGGDHWLLGWDVADKDDGRPFVARVADVTSGRMTEVRGLLDDPGSASIHFVGSQRPPSDDEWEWAVKKLREAAADALEEAAAAAHDAAAAAAEAAADAEPDLAAEPAVAVPSVPRPPSVPPVGSAGGSPLPVVRFTDHVEDEDDDEPERDLPPLDAYRPMPPLANVVDADGVVRRVVTVGLRADDGTHSIVGVRVGDGEQVELGPDVTALAAGPECGLPPGDACGPVAGSERARVRVVRGDTVLWDLVVVRAPGSSGTNGSGVELCDVDHLGKRVLSRAHLPILNVAYRGAGDSPVYRSWLHDEACFEATGDDVAAGFRLCTEPPVTALESETDGGAFRGVALWVDGEDLVVVSQLRAGWHRYVSEWRLGADGTIAPRLGIATARHGGGGWVHTHHAYWRFDFDIVGPAENTVQEHNDPPVFGTTSWHTIRHEMRRTRSPESDRYWRVRNDRSSRSYSLVPGAGDGEADGFGVGDVWLLRYSPDEIDDGQGFTADPVLARAGLDRFLTGEPTHREDVVLWYSAHLVHEPASSPVAGRIGPDVRARLWSSEPSAELQPAGIAESGPSAVTT
ncbi:MAG: hypothetical protein ACRD0Q_02295 [Acidimicrobiales bacterium]